MFLFSGTPLILYVLGVLFLTIKWATIGTFLLTGRSIKTLPWWIWHLFVLYLIILTITWFPVYWITSIGHKIRYYHFQVIQFSFYWIYIVLVILNLIFIIVLRRRMPDIVPLLYNKLKWKLFGYLIITIILLIIRMVLFIIYYAFKDKGFDNLVAVQDFIGRI